MPTEISPLDAIEQITKKIEETMPAFTDEIDVFPSAKIKWLVCTDCKHIYTHDLSKGVPPTTCPECNSATRQHVALSEENARMFAEKAKSTETRPAAPASPVTSGVRESVEPEPPKKPRNKKPPAAPVAQPAPAPAPAPVEAEVEEWKRHLVYKTGDGEDENTLDYEASYSSQVKWLTKKYGLNTLTPRIIGTGKVYTQGLRAWMKSGSHMDTAKMESDTPAFWRSLYDELRADPDTSNVEQIVYLTDVTEDLTFFTRGGRQELHASLRHGRSRLIAPTGSRVKLGAYLSKKGSLVWVVLEVIK